MIKKLKFIVSKIHVEKQILFWLTSDSHDAIVTSFKNQLVYNECGRDRLRGCGVYSGAVILKKER